LGAPFVSALGCGEREGPEVSVGVGDGVSSGLGVGEFRLCFRFPPGVEVGEGVGETFLCFGEAVGEGVDVAFFFRCLLFGAGVGVGSKTFLIFLPNDSSALTDITIAPQQIATDRMTRRTILVAENNQRASS
jgi:hypothetical protein